MKPCNWCDSRFKPSVSYQIYCSVSCRSEATKEKISQRYEISKRKKRKNKNRKCISGCGTTLSVYNDESICYDCSINPKDVNKALKKIKGMLK